LNINEISAIAIIPARHASTRLPGKPLLDIAGKPLLQRVWESVLSSVYLNRVIIATDDAKIAELCDMIGAEYVMTPPDLPSGSDRIMYAYNEIGEDAGIIVNVQGDEPFMTGEIIDNLIDEFIKSNADVGTLVCPIKHSNELTDPSVVKVVIAENSTAMYFSRSPIPFFRDLAPEEWLNKRKYYKHIGVYAYQTESLNRFTTLPPSELELTEKLEQLRLLEFGAKYLCVETDAELIGVDTYEDLERVRKIFAK
jgi:3-deoxy-manno-octulosonate cytidylyltransferase (CMP-KDO synthetase)